MKPADDATSHAPFSVAAVLQALDLPAVVVHGDVIAWAGTTFADQLARDGAKTSDLTNLRLNEPSERLDDSVRELLRSVPAESAVHLRAVPIWPRDRRRNVNVVTVPLTGGSVLVLLPDAHEEDHAERKRRRDDRLQSLGVIAAGVAHDLNNQLAATLNITALLREEFGSTFSHDRALEIIEGSAKEAAALAHRLLRFCGRGEAELKEVKLHERLDLSLSLVRHELPSAGLTCELAESLGVARGDPVEIEQIFVAMLLAGAAAAGPNGEMHVRSRRRNAGDVDGLDAGAFAEIEVIHPAVAHTSSALTIAAREASDLGGRLCSTTVQAETHHVLFLPIDRSSGETPEKSPADATGAAIAATILVVDDDPMVRDVAVAMITRLGYRALSARGGFEAIEAFGRETKIDLVILDLIMNEMGGVETLRRIRAIRPDVTVLLSSGFSEGVDLPELAGAGFAGMLEKPYSLASLRETLERALEGRNG